ncbi:MAG: T9SS type A sorting domain-containing protein [Bacteroidales bacterium]|nr:T9SS type A sorting domain-containing protein [Bacteroidales bacterium]
MKHKFMTGLFAGLMCGLFACGNSEKDIYRAFRLSEKHERPSIDLDFKDTIIDFDKLKGPARVDHVGYVKALEASQYILNAISSLKVLSAEEQLAEQGVYANGKVEGTWRQLIPHTTGKTKITGKGFRMDGSAYDPETEILYVVPYSTHLWKLDRKSEDKWFLLNNKITLNRIFDGFNLPDGSFRLIRSHKESNTMGNMMYSEDGGRNFTSLGQGLDSIWKFMDFDFTPNEEFIFGVAEGMGAWVYVKAHDRWYRMSEGIVPTNVKWTRVSYLENKHCVRFETYGAGVLDYYLNENMIVDLPTMISQDKSGIIRLYPQPVSDRLFVDNTSGINYDLVEIYDTGGRLIKKQTIETKQRFSLLDQNLNSGYYILNLRGQESSQMQS